MGNWIADKIFTNADEFLTWLDEKFGDYINQHINSNHVHHTWKPDHSNYPKYTTLQLHKNMRSFHMNTNGWDDIAQNITIGKDGDIVTGRDIRLVPISAKGHNGTTNLHPFAYEMIGNFDKGNDKLEGKQLESAIKISRYFYKKGKGIWFHRELLLPNGLVPKTCPGTGIEKEWFMSLVKDCKYDVGAKVEQTKPEVKPTEQTKTPSIPMFKEVTFKQGQIGLLTVLKPINLWKRNESNKLEMVRILNVGEKYRVYGYDDLYGGQYNVGGLYVTKMTDYILYETPSKQFIQQATEYYANQSK